MNQGIEEHLRVALEQQRAAFASEIFPTLAVRRDRLARVRQMTEKHAQDLAAAIAQDFENRARQETLLTEVFTVQSAVRHAIRHLPGWMKTRSVPTAMHFWPARNRLLRQPLGVVGVVSPWNYPYYLAMAPALAALAAGNRVLVKPSELTPATSELMARMVREHFAPEEMQVIVGDADVGRAFTSLPFDHLFFTGSTAVGRIVAQAAARNLTPVTLELGGKSPALVDRSADIGVTAERLAFGKLLNAGQTCVAPDYVLAPREMVGPLADAVLGRIRTMYPKLSDNPDYTSIVSPRHFERLQGLLRDAQAKGARLVPTHAETPAGRRLVPHLVLDATEQMTVMQEEIFGPLLPIVAYDKTEEALAYIQRHDRPLALYWFGSDSHAQRRVMEQTHAGGVTVNDCIWHLGQEEQPFGGVGASGIGSYHGEWGFRTFSKEKPIFEQTRFAGTKLFYPPYGATFDRMIGLLKKIAG
ncbi:MAG TPA: coniferyl aldehyde dehydrogenase [Ideonella sp.]|uniref:coniferyl aldehyde dehydrogenase n=1 Tax=Ideonella sp. TaxID=1929293 RepID=UPI002E37F0B2|nr:coniferyl aldehyde dehydrogenase [Ideonella sp.]HEX5683439.1 coniferyl aldehyde dehydrogenase [Ideonella sp.]